MVLQTCSTGGHDVDICITLVRYLAYLYTRAAYGECNEVQRQSYACHPLAIFWMCEDYLFGKVVSEWHAYIHIHLHTSIMCFMPPLTVTKFNV